MRDKLARFMYGRYGVVDALGRTVMILGIIFVVLNMFFPKAPFYILALICLAYAYFRLLSRNVAARYQENQRFVQAFSGVSRWFGRQKSYGEIRKTSRIFTCPSCRQKVRVPKGKGRISIHCPKCGTDFVKKS